MLGKGNVKMAVAALRSSRWRSLLTMLGIIIGVLSVITTVSLGEGIKQRIVGQITRSGPDLITVRPGRIVTRDQHGSITSVNLLSAFNLGSLSEDDLHTIQNTKDVKEAVPFSYITGVAHIDDREYNSGPLIATSDGAARMLNQKLAFGNFFGPEDSEKNAAVIGKKVAEQLFKENVPIGKSFTVRDQTFIVHGIFEEFTTSPLAINADYNYAIFIPYDSGKHIGGSQEQIYQILARPQSPGATSGTVSAITRGLTTAHNGQIDFTVLTQAENLAVANSVLNILTGFIAGIAAISLIVGGIGIMNVMLVSVTERTREIGVRKAIGATNHQILGQFLIEAVILSFTGGIIGVLLAGLANYLMRIFTTLTPVITLPTVIISVGVAVLVGVIFGVMPAMRAARKDPIEALRYE
jgi:putative ABC transport system permease protein